MTMMPIFNQILPTVGGRKLFIPTASTHNGNSLKIWALQFMTFTPTRRSLVSRIPWSHHHENGVRKFSHISSRYALSVVRAYSTNLLSSQKQEEGDPQQQHQQNSHSSLPVSSSAILRQFGLLEHHPTGTHPSDDSREVSFTPGHVWHILQSYKLAQKNRVSLFEFQQLVAATRPNYKKDAKVVLTALQDLKRCNQFCLTRSTAQLAIEGMIRSSMPKIRNTSERQVGTGSASDGSIAASGNVDDTEFQKKKIKSLLWVGEAFLNKSSGLYFATETKVVDDLILKSLFETLQQLMQEKNINAILQLLQENDRGDTTLPESHDISQKIFVLISGIVDSLFERCSKPARGMKKRAARKYLKQLQCSQGPSPTTIDLSVKICLMVKGEKDTEERLQVVTKMLQQFESKKWLGTPLEDTRKKIAEAQMMT